MLQYLSLKVIGLAVVSSIFLFGCSTSNIDKRRKESTNDLYTIDVESVIRNKLYTPLSEVGTDIIYLPLETRNDNLLRKIRKIEITESFIFVSDKRNLLQFTKNGEFIRQIGKIGKGPGEYISILNFSVNEKANTIILLGEYRFMKYNLQGNFIRRITNPISTEFVFYRPDRIAFYHATNIETNKTNLILTNQDLKVVFKFQNYNPRPKTNMSLQNAPLYVFENKPYFKEHYNDTLFWVKDSVLIPHIVYNEKNLLLDHDFEFKYTGKISDIEKQFEKVKNKLLTENIFESKRFVFTSYQKGCNPRKINYTRILFNKEKNKITAIKGNAFVNDIDGGPNFYPEKIVNDSKLVMWLDAFKLKEHVASSAFKSSTPKYPEKKKELEKLANSLKEDDNPVLMLVKLKE